MDLAALADVTIVVPVGPGDALSPRLRAQLACLPAQVRVVYADTTPVDSPADRGGARWQATSAPRGRASQQNAGARGAGAAWLWFLHADCELAPGSLPALARFTRSHIGEDVLGYFDLAFLDDGPALMRLNAAGAWIRSHALGLPFGDQGLLLPRRTFERMGGFDPSLAGGEDHDLVWRLRRAGVPLKPIGAPLFTSARKYRQHGWWVVTKWHLRETWHQARRFSRAQGSP